MPMARVSMDERRAKPLALQTSLPRPSTGPHSGPPLSNRQEMPSTTKQIDSTAEVMSRQRRSGDQAIVPPGHQRFVLTDVLAFRYLEEDPSTTVLERRAELQGYECYIVEQWATSRTHPTFVITNFTGDPAHKVAVSVLSVPTDEADWSPRLRVYFRALNQYHAKRRQTPLGILFVTALSGFPSSLTVIPVPDGDLRAHRADFFVNENLKRFGCSGRVALQLATPAPATVAKFHQLYRTSDKNDIYGCVIELVKLCQAALLLFGKLQIDYADGLLCDVTERAVNDWWVELGAEQYNVEPHDGILGPTTVAGLLGLLMGARNRLHAVGAPVTKDPFDVDNMKRGISHFQKAQSLPRTRRLDRRTLERLHRTTQKAADHEGWMAVPRAFKSTVAELSGKGGEMVMDAVGRRDRAGIAEVETCDLERFVQLVYGQRAKWLWFGKPLKLRARDKEQATQKAALAATVPADSKEYSGLIFRPAEHGGFTWTSRKTTAEILMRGRKEADDDLASPATAEEDSEESDDLRFKSAIKRASGFKHEAKSGLNKIKGAVGLRGHHHSKPSADETQSQSPAELNGKTRRRPPFLRSVTSPTSSPTSLASPTSPRSPMSGFNLDAAVVERRTDRQRHVTDPEQHAATKASPAHDVPVSSDSLPPPPVTYLGNDNHDSDSIMQPHLDTAPPRASFDGILTAEPSVTGSISHSLEIPSAPPEAQHEPSQPLRRTLSLGDIISPAHAHSEDLYPRHISFSLAEDSVLTWSDLADGQIALPTEPRAQLATEELRAAQVKNLLLALHDLQASTVPWTGAQLQTLNLLLEQGDKDQTSIEELYMPRLESVRGMQARGEGVLRFERERLGEGGREIETLKAKLEYEVNGLRGKIEDVEAGVGEFGKGVRRLEDRVGELEAGERKAGRWWEQGCVVC